MFCDIDEIEIKRQLYNTDVQIGDKLTRFIYVLYDKTFVL